MHTVLVLLACFVLLTPNFLAENGTDLITFDCDSKTGTLTIKGHVVKSSHIKPSKCKSMRVSKIVVFAVSIFRVQTSLVFEGYEDIRIFANKWVIEQPTVFNFFGSPGKNQTKPTAAGIAGKPGNAGKNGPNFFGLSNEWTSLHGSVMVVFLAGGDGGAGQDGTKSEDSRVKFNAGELHFLSNEWPWDITTKG